MKDKRINVRMNAATLEKLRYIAQQEDRSINGQIIYLINRCIYLFEKEHGKIDLTDQDR